MTPFHRVYGGGPRITVEEIMRKFGYTRERAEEQLRKIIEEINDSEVWANDLYQVIKRRVPTGKHGFGDTTMIYLSIRRLDKDAVHDWRHLQQIKSELVGAECEGFELYPAESRVVDTSNQYHLWVFEDTKFEMPIGFFDGRHVDYSNDGEHTRQRPKD